MHNSAKVIIISAVTCFSLWLGKGRLAESNVAQVIQVRKIIDGLGLEVATPAEARRMLDLKGGDQVAF
jgi:beta-keto acid cleavage enzyme